MKFVKFAAVAAAVGAVATLATAPAKAVTFAQFEMAPNSTLPNMFWVQDAAKTGGTLYAFDAPVQFSLQTNSGVVNVPALFTLTGTATSTPANNLGGLLFQGGLGGTFEFTYAGTTPLACGHSTCSTGADLLSGTFAKANISGQTNSSAGNVDDATSAGDVLSLKSDFVTFAPGDTAYSFSLTSINPLLSASSGQSLNTFAANATGSFQAPLSILGGAGGVPEPATWAMFIVGVAGMGAALRRRSYSLVTA